MALQLMPRLLSRALKMTGEDKTIHILVATSGDTGKAALEGYSDVDGVKITVFYPVDGVSEMQKRQMQTTLGDNVYVAAVEGNFDDAQTGVKKIFADKEFGAELADHGFQFSSANSINIGRLVPQVVYYVYAYASLLANEEIKDGEEINVTVPTGNFGNILAAYFAKQLGVPIKKLICASNDNKVLYDFFQTGTYDRQRDFILTTSPSMDILISSNLERLLYLSTGCDAEQTAKLMNQLGTEGHYTVTPEMKAKMADFCGGFATEAEDAAAIRELYDETGYVIDTHTGVASAVYQQYKKNTGDETKTVIASTASPYKFSRSVMEAISDEKLPEDEFAVIDELCRVSGVEIPKAVEEIRNAQIRHKLECDVQDMKKTVAKILGI